MRVLQVASEAAPFAKTGGLADVAGSLPAALERIGCDCTLIMPAYRQVFEAGIPIEKTELVFDVPVGQRHLRAEIFRSTLPGSNVPVYFVGNEACFGRPTLYGGGHDYPDNAERFILFSRAAMELAGRLEKPFDVLHGHDWQAGLIPAYRRLLYQAWPMLAHAVTVQTIHNMAYQGTFWHWDMLLTGIDWKYFNWKQMECHGQLNFLKTGLVFADAITTVSPTYAREITEAPGGCGLEGVVASRAEVLSGIVNGIDTTVWDPQSDPLIPRHYHAADTSSGKDAARIALAARLGHPAPDPRPLVSFVGRLAEQKGVDLLVESLWRRCCAALAHDTRAGGNERPLSGQKVRKNGVPWRSRPDGSLPHLLLHSEHQGGSRWGNAAPLCESSDLGEDYECILPNKGRMTNVAPEEVRNPLVRAVSLGV